MLVVTPSSPSCPPWPTEARSPSSPFRTATAALEGVVGLDDERAPRYSDLIRISLGEAARRAFEDLMATGNYEYQSEF